MAKKEVKKVKEKKATTKKTKTKKDSTGNAIDPKITTFDKGQKLEDGTQFFDKVLVKFNKENHDVEELAEYLAEKGD